MVLTDSSALVGLGISISKTLSFQEVQTSLWVAMTPVFSFSALPFTEKTTYNSLAWKRTHLSISPRLLSGLGQKLHDSKVEGCLGFQALMGHLIWLLCPVVQAKSGSFAEQLVS
jgi:fucose 4-O-acetylase-like acetyltransferase